MSGHSKWSTIKRKKGAADAKRGQIFTRLSREIVIAARTGGGDLNSNFRLRLAIDKARAENMPKDNIDRAIKRGTGEDKDAAAFEEMILEGYGPHGSALMVECVTDNRNRTVADLRHAFSRNGGNLAEPGAVGWQFEQKAYFSFPASTLSFDSSFELAIEAGADDVLEDGDNIEIVGPVDVFKTLSDALGAAGVKPDEAGLRMIPKQEMDLSADQILQVLRVVDSIEEMDDVQNVYHNVSITDEVLTALESE
ncbi:MAG: YebC/PmpR family DNA-binding transcriptional regulator [Anaerolineales bacterium]|nr:YebC/PmpR family DNA-binding transcriptional regulator [Anaerolineales bacterium]